MLLVWSEFSVQKFGNNSIVLEGSRQEAFAVFRHSKFHTVPTTSVDQFIDLVLNSYFTFLHYTAPLTDEERRPNPLKCVTARLDPERGKPFMVAKARGSAFFALQHGSQQLIDLQNPDISNVEGLALCRASTGAHIEL